MSKVDGTRKHCGIVMPISECDGRPASHWAEVLHIIQDTAVSAGFNARLVSDAMESNLIHKEILANIYNDDIVVVDVSGRNPNVFFELGIRMATQKPTVIVKDHTTPYPFDTGPNRFIEYPSDLRHPQMEIFKKRLLETLKTTVEHKAENSFIGQLGPFQIPKIEAKEVPINDAILGKLEAMERRLSTMASLNLHGDRDSLATIMPFSKDILIRRRSDGSLELACRDVGIDQIKAGIEDFSKGTEVNKSKVVVRRDGALTFTLHIEGEIGRSIELIRALAYAVDSAIPF